MYATKNLALALALALLAAIPTMASPLPNNALADPLCLTKCVETLDQCLHGGRRHRNKSTVHTWYGTLVCVFGIMQLRTNRSVGKVLAKTPCASKIAPRRMLALIRMCDQSVLREIAQERRPRWIRAGSVRLGVAVLRAHRSMRRVSWANLVRSVRGSFAVGTWNRCTILS